MDACRYISASAKRRILREMSWLEELKLYVPRREVKEEKGFFDSIFGLKI